MTPKKPVKLFWYPAEEQGRKAPPPGPKYFAVFKPKSAGVADEDWSVLLELLPRSEHKYLRDGLLSFVSEEAPFSSLRPGYTFYLFEGRWPVAEGVVLQENEADA
jgi:hypothetical protein